MLIASRLNLNRENSILWQGWLLSQLLTKAQNMSEYGQLTLTLMDFEHFLLRLTLTSDTAFVLWLKCFCWLNQWFPCVCWCHNCHL